MPLSEQLEWLAREMGVTAAVDPFALAEAADFFLVPKPMRVTAYAEGSVLRYDPRAPDVSDAIVMLALARIMRVAGFNSDNQSVRMVAIALGYEPHVKRAECGSIGSTFRAVS